jgi:Na+/proline symporter
MIPYIALQLKAVSASFKMILREDSVLEVFDPTLVVAVTLALFGILFGARNLDFTKRQTGLMTAVAVESVIKLIAFLLVGVYVTWWLFGGFGDLFGQVAAHPEWSKLLTLGQPETASFPRWAAMLLISMAAVMFLPRQFHVLVVQNPRERDVTAVSWSFPLYLLLINVFVLPIAFAGLLVFPDAQAQADGFILRLPLFFHNQHISVLVFLGGFSAATAMIVVDSLALSKMITNDVILPVLLRQSTASSSWWRWACSRSSRSPSARPPSCWASTGVAATGVGPSWASRPASSCGSTPSSSPPWGGRVCSAPRSWPTAHSGGACCAPPPSWGWKGSTPSATGCSGRCSSTWGCS